MIKWGDIKAESAQRKREGSGGRWSQRTNNKDEGAEFTKMEEKQEEKADKIMRK